MKPSDSSGTIFRPRKADACVWYLALVPGWKTKRATFYLCKSVSSFAANRGRPKISYTCCFFSFFGLAISLLLGRHTWFPTLLVHVSILPSFLAFSVYWTTFVVLATTDMTGNIAVTLISTGDFVQFLV